MGAAHSASPEPSTDVSNMTPGRTGDDVVGEERDASLMADAIANEEGVTLWADERPLPPWVQDFARSVDVDSIVALVVPKCLAIAFPAHRDDPTFRERLTTSTSANARSLQAVIAGELSLPEVPLDSVLPFASVQAQLRIPQKSMQRSYRVSFFTMLEQWSARLGDEIDRRVIEPGEAAEAQRLLSQTILGYLDYVAAEVAETYTRDYELLSRSREHIRRSLVGDLLRSEEAVLSPADTTLLGYDVGAHHLGVLLPTMPVGAAERIATGMQQTAECQHHLTYPLGVSTTFVWLGRVGMWREPALARLEHSLRQSGVTASLGAPAQGVTGFRATLAQAQETERVRAAWRGPGDPQVLRYSQARLEILLLQDPDKARTFVEQELGPLLTGTTEASRLLDTLDATFRFGSYVGAAEHLKLHEHTVRNRLQKIEELLGHSLQDRPTEMRVACRLARLLD